MSPDPLASPAGPLVLGRYAVYGEIASGGMASVHLGRIIGAVGFARTVAIKRLHPHMARDPDFVTMFTDEARLAARLHHPNVIPTLDVVAEDGELFLVMEYVHGDSLAHLVLHASEQKRRLPIPVVGAILAGALHGLHAAHEAKDDRGQPLGIVHRDVSPQNILVGVDGVTRVIDFGVAKALGRLHTTREGQIKGKLGYMPPEQLHDEGIDRRTDVYAAGVLLWEALTGERLFSASSDAAMLMRVLSDPIFPPSSKVPTLPPALDAIVMRALERDPRKRFPSAQEMAREIERTVPLASAAEVGKWVEDLSADALDDRKRAVASMEEESRGASLTPSGHGLAAGRISGALPRLRTAVDDATVLESRTPASTDRPKTVRWPARVAVGALIAAAFAALVLVGSSRRAPAEAPSAAAPLPSSSAVAVPAASSASVASGDEAPPVSVGDLPTAPPPDGSSRKTGRTTRAAPPTKRAGCDPPFSIDASGHKHFKRECM